MQGRIAFQLDIEIEGDLMEQIDAVDFFRHDPALQPPLLFKQVLQPKAEAERLHSHENRAHGEHGIGRQPPGCKLFNHKQSANDIGSIGEA